MLLKEGLSILHAILPSYFLKQSCIRSNCRSEISSKGQKSCNKMCSYGFFSSQQLWEESHWRLFQREKNKQKPVNLHVHKFFWPPPLTPHLSFVGESYIKTVYLSLNFALMEGVPVFRCHVTLSLLTRDLSLD